MDWVRFVVSGTIIAIVIVTLASGSVTSLIDANNGGYENSAFGSGSADVSVESVPSTVYLDHSAYGAESYYVRVPNAIIRIKSTENNPFFLYKLRVPGLNYIRINLYTISERDIGRTALSFGRDALSPDQINRSEYTGEIVIILRGSGDGRILYRGNVTVEVNR